MVGVADDQFAMGRGADQQVNAVLLQMRRFAQDLRLDHSGFRQVGESAVMHATQAGEQGVLQVQIKHRPRTQHLQAAGVRVERGDGFGQQGLIVVA